MRLRYIPEQFLIGVAILGHAMLLILTLQGQLSPLFNDSAHRAGMGCDFFAIYQAGHNAHLGRSIYHLDSAGDLVVPYAYEYRYLPITAQVIGTLLNGIPPWIAYAFWIVVCETCLLLGILIAFRQRENGPIKLGVLFLWIGFSPYYLELWVGQFSFVVGVMLYAAMVLYEERQRAGAALIWVVGVLFKPAAVGWSALWIKQRMYGVPLLTAGIVICNCSYFFAFPNDWSVFRAINFSPIPTWHAGNVGLCALTYLLLGNTWFFIAARLCSAALLTAPLVALTLRAGPETARRSFWLLAGCWIVLQLLLFRDMWEHHLTILLPFLSLGLTRLRGWKSAIIAVFLALPSPFVLYDLPSLGHLRDPEPYLDPLISLIQHSWRALPLLVLYLYWMSEARKLAYQFGEESELRDYPANDGSRIGSVPVGAAPVC